MINGVGTVLIPHGVVLSVKRLVYRVVAAFPTGDHHIVNAPLGQKRLRGGFVQLLHGLKLRGIVHSMVIHIQAAATYNVPPGQADHRVQMLRSGEKQGVGRSVFVHKGGHCDAGFIKLLVLADGLAPQGEDAAEGAQKHQAAAQQCGGAAAA